MPLTRILYTILELNVGLKRMWTTPHIMDRACAQEGAMPTNSDPQKSLEGPKLEEKALTPRLIQHLPMDPEVTSKF